MELYQLEYFLEAARQRNFTRAAQRLMLAQAALSEQIRKLEQELGATLFDRGHRETTLTAAGETLRQHAELLLAQASAAKRAVNDVVQMRSGRIALATIPSLNAGLLAPLLGEYIQQYPGIDIQLLEGTSENVAQWVEEGRAEWGVVQHPTALQIFEERLLVDEPFVLLVSCEHPLAGRRRIRLSSLADQRFVFHRGRARDAAVQACRSAGFEPRIVCENCELESVFALVGSHVAVSLLPELASRRNRADCVSVSLSENPLRRQVVLLSRPAVSLSPAASGLRDWLERRVAGIRN
jgi:LysR family transcriptional regulator, hydrogen peroxide-inducible genes activator